ncbi:MAG: hypothetical protein HY513_02465 [Candidatus Aenigmarchaeota archaeon]|nr:hypothetical protein [Candidatus Aenigmarchaeota archaeon]
MGIVIQPQDTIMYGADIVGNIVDFPWSVDGLAYCFISSAELAKVLSAPDEARMSVGGDKVQAGNFRRSMEQSDRPVYVSERALLRHYKELLDFEEGFVAGIKGDVVRNRSDLWVIGYNRAPKDFLFPSL